MPYEDHDLDSFMESHINHGYGEILDQVSGEFEAPSHDDDREFDDDDYEEEWEDMEGGLFEGDCHLDGDHETGLRDAGFGTDEDYGYYGGDEYDF